MGVKAGCTPRDDVLQGELNDAIFAASFGRLIRSKSDRGLVAILDGRALGRVRCEYHEPR